MTPATGRLLVIGSAVAWSTAGIFTKGVGADVWVVLFWRGLIAGVLMMAYLSWRGGDSHPRAWRRLGWPGWAAATAGSTATVCFIAAFKNTDVANVAIIYATAPFAAAAIAWFWMRERPAVATLVAAVLCLIGVLIMVGGSAGSANLTGDMLAVGMTVLMALMMVIIRRYPDRPMTLAIGPLSCVQLVALGWAMSAPFDVSLMDLVLLTGFGLSHATATILLAEGVRRITASEAGLLGSLEMPLVPLWGWLFLAEIPRMMTFVGGAVVLATLIWYLGRDMRSRSERLQT
jgi:drug/metabolite transporter (DMT)-like permease